MDTLVHRILIVQNVTKIAGFTFPSSPSSNTKRGVGDALKVAVEVEVLVVNALVAVRMISFFWKINQNQSEKSKLVKIVFFWDHKTKIDQNQSKLENRKLLNIMIFLILINYDHKIQNHPNPDW